METSMEVKIGNSKSNVDHSPFHRIRVRSDLIVWIVRLMSPNTSKWEAAQQTQGIAQNRQIRSPQHESLRFENGQTLKC